MPSTPVKLKIPVFGDLILKTAVSRFARTFGTLITSGVPVLRALEIVSDTAGQPRGLGNGRARPGRASRRAIRSALLSSGARCSR